MSSLIIQAITMRLGVVTVKYLQPVKEGRTIASTFPGAGSDPVLPTVAFADALEDTKSAIVSAYSLSTDWEWRMDAVSFTWNEEHEEYGFSATLTAVNPAIGKQTNKIAQSSPSHVPIVVMKALEELQEEAIGFVRGASAQGNLFEEKEEGDE